MKRTIVMVLILAMLLPTLAFAASDYSDVPENSWAKADIEAAGTYGLMTGMGGGQFGYGKTISRAEFVTVLTRMFSMKASTAASEPYSDVADTDWYSAAVKAALENDVIDSAAAFRPNDAITRVDMAVMLVRALGYKSLAESANGYVLPFDDVTANRGYIAVAYDIGMTKGTSATTFSPSATAKREEAAAMMVRIYDKLEGKTEWLHGFYAFSSYSQRALTSNMDAVSAGWSLMCLDAVKGAWLNTTTSGENYWSVPDGYESITEYFKNNSTPLSLDVYMDTSEKVTLADGTSASALSALLTSADHRAEAVGAIVAEATRVYEKIGRSPYSGVTIDFEGLKGSAVKAGFTAFIQELSAKLKPLGLSLYVAVQPVLADGVYFDGFDYKAIGEAADKVILMAHDFNATSLKGFLGTEYYKTTALTPMNSVYLALREILKEGTGVADASKVAIAVSFSSIGWQIDENGKLLSETPVTPSGSTLSGRMAQEDTEFGWSEEYKNPYVTYTTEDGEHYFVWYEDQSSVDEKLTLARLMGVTGVSVWRIGTIPQFENYAVDF